MYTLGKRHNGQPLHLDEKTRRIHAAFVGATGAGKTTLFYNLMQDDMRSGRGFALIDPHGDIALKIADHIPPDRISDVVYLDVTDKEFAVGFNPLSAGIDPAVLTYNLVASFKYIYHDSWGPRLEYILGNALRLLLASPGSTLVELPRLLVDEPYRQKMLNHCKDPVIRLFWEVEFKGYSERIRSEAILPIQNKIGQLIANPTIRAIMGQESTFSIDEIINNRKILICNISKSMGDEPSHLLGAFLVTAIAQSAQARSDMAEDDRQDFTLYVDEFQNFATETFASILSEMRKYRLNLVVANQFMAQLPPLLRQSVLGNVGTLCVLRVGAEDAPLLAGQLAFPNPKVLTETPNYTAWVKTMDGDAPSEPTFIKLCKEVRARRGSLPAVQKRNRSRHARRRDEVETNLAQLFPLPGKRKRKTMKWEDG